MENETGYKAQGWGQKRKNINFINQRPAMVKGAVSKQQTVSDEWNVKGEDIDGESKGHKEDRTLTDLEIALMVKHSDPLKYYELKQKKKLEMHEKSYNALHQLTKGKRPDQMVELKEGSPAGEDGGAGGEKSFRNKMFELLEKTNQRVQLDRPFLIKEKMQVIMIDSENHSPRNTAR